MSPLLTVRAFLYKTLLINRDAKGDKAMKKKSIMLFAGVVWCGLSMLGGGLRAQELEGAVDLKAIAQERILYANRAFREAVTNSPDEEQAVTASFTRSMTLREAVDKALAQGFTIEGFRHGDATHSGGYIIAPEQSLEDAMAKYEASIPALIEQHLVNVEDMLQDESDEESRAALEQSRREFLQQREKYKRQGLRVIGIDLRGKGRALEQFQQTDPSIRVMELRHGNRRNAAIPTAD